VAVPAPPRTMAFAQLLGLDRHPRFPGHNVLEDLVDVGLGEILNSPGPYQRNYVTFDAAGVGDDRRGLLRPPSLSQDESGLKISEIAGAQLLYSDRLVIELAIFDGIISPSDPTELHLRLSARSLRRPGSVEAQLCSDASGLLFDTG
jgi:hypothetical protein